jgi:hypothetical protein
MLITVLIRMLIAVLIAVDQGTSGTVRAGGRS